MIFELDAGVGKKRAREWHQPIPDVQDGIDQHTALVSRSRPGMGHSQLSNRPTIHYNSGTDISCDFNCKWTTRELKYELKYAALGIRNVYKEVCSNILSDLLLFISYIMITFIEYRAAYININFIKIVLMLL